MWQIFNQKSFNYFSCTSLGSRVNTWINFFLQIHLKVSTVWYFSHYFPVSTTQSVLVAKSATGVHLELRKSPRIFEKCRNDPDVIFWGLGKDDSWKKPEAKNLVTLSLSLTVHVYSLFISMWLGHLLYGVNSVPLYIWDHTFNCVPKPRERIYIWY